MTDTSGRPATLHAYFSYRDAPAALRWLERAFGFETTLEVPDDRGGIMHSELRREGVAIVVFSDGVGYERPARKGETVGAGAYIAVDADATVDAVFTSAVDAGATAIWEPAGTAWGNYRCRAACSSRATSGPSAPIDPARAPATSPKATRAPRASASAGSPVGRRT